MLIELSYRFLGYTGLLEPLGMLMKNRMFAYVALVMALAIGPARVDQSAGQSAAVPQLGAWGFDTSGIDPKAKPEKQEKNLKKAVAKLLKKYPPEKKS